MGVKSLVYEEQLALLVEREDGLLVPPQRHLEDQALPEHLFKGLAEIRVHPLKLIDSWW